MEGADIGLWSIDGHFLQVLKGHTASITSLAVTPDGKTLISGSKDKTIRLWNLKNPNDFPINELSGKDVAELSLKSKIPTLTEGVRHAIKFTLALIRLRQEFDIDIEDSSNDIASSEFDIEIEG
jgi:WD40 repeat protein